MTTSLQYYFYPYPKHSPERSAMLLIDTGDDVVIGTYDAENNIFMDEEGGQVGCIQWAYLRIPIVVGD